MCDVRAGQFPFKGDRAADMGEGAGADEILSAENESAFFYRGGGEQRNPGEIDGGAGNARGSSDATRAAGEV